MNVSKRFSYSKNDIVDDKNTVKNKVCKSDMQNVQNDLRILLILTVQSLSKTDGYNSRYEFYSLRLSSNGVRKVVRTSCSDE